MSLSIDTESEIRATKESLIETRYVGSNPTLKGTSGDAYLHLTDNQWFYRPNSNGNNWFRVESKSLSCNLSNGWLRASYLGKNSLFGLGRNGKAMFSEEANSWIFKPKDSKEEFRVGEENLKFHRDKDLTKN